MSSFSKQQSGLLFAAQPKLVFHGAYHKMGTVWITRVLEGIARRFDLTVQKVNQRNEPLLPEANIVIANHSDLELDSFGDFVGSHMIRDPRDAIVSGYFYHLWTTEAWAHEPQERLNGQSIQQHLNSLKQSEGILFEISRFEEYVRNRGLLDWNFEDDRIIALTYEQLIENESACFERLFQHYGFHRSAIQTCLDLVRQFSARVSDRAVGESLDNQHLRSGKPGQWSDLFSEVHVLAFKERLGEALIVLGYEDDLDW